MTAQFHLRPISGLSAVVAYVAPSNVHSSKHAHHGARSAVSDPPLLSSSSDRRDDDVLYSLLLLLFAIRCLVSVYLCSTPRRVGMYVDVSHPIFCISVGLRCVVFSPSPRYIWTRNVCPNPKALCNLLPYIFNNNLYYCI